MIADKRIRVLLVDDEESLCTSLAKWLREEHGYNVETAADGAQALHLLAERSCFDVALLDYLLPPPHNGISYEGDVRRCPAGSIEFIISPAGAWTAGGGSGAQAGAIVTCCLFNEEELAV
jgi:CheY-like chemotaxis protein